MIPCIIVGGLFLLFLVIFISMNKHFHNDFTEFIAPAITVVFGLFVFGVGCALVMTHVQAPEDTAEIYADYQNLTYKVEHIECYNWYEVREEVNEWNTNLHEMREGKESLWRNWFLPYSIDNVDMIEMPEFSVCPVCGNHKTVVPDT